MAAPTHARLRGAKPYDSRRGSMPFIHFKRVAASALLISTAALLVACGTEPVGPGYYRVVSGDTLMKIARANHQSLANLKRWNNLSNPDALEVGQVLRVTPPGSAASSGAVVSTTPAPGNAASPPSDTGSIVQPAARIALIWPAPGKVERGFDGAQSKGIDITNGAGTIVVAAATGTVVYAGDGLRGYGQLVILKHDNDFLTAYAHNRALLVKEGQVVQQGQQIAEMGDTDSDHVALHFELRYNGHSIDPARYLPPR
jgi:lipoprotein YgeR